MTTLDTKAEQLERLIARIETRFKGKFITEEQWKFVLDRLTNLEKKKNKQEYLRHGRQTLTSQIKEQLKQNPAGLTVQQLSEKTEGDKAVINSCLYYLIKKGTVTRTVSPYHKGKVCIYHYQDQQEDPWNQ